MSTSIVLNVGCANNPFFPAGDRVGSHAPQLLAVIRSLFEPFHVIVHNVIQWSESEYDGKPEDTAIIRIDCGDNILQDGIKNRILRLCEILTQECIAIKINDSGFLVWAPKEVPLFGFDPQYFIEWVE